MSFKASNKLREIALSFFCVYYYYCMYVGTTTISQNSSRYHISRKACFEVSLLLYVNVVLIQCNAARYLLGRCLLLQVFIQMVTLYWHKYLKLSLLLTLKMETLYSCVYYILHCVNHNADFCILKLAFSYFQHWYLINIQCTCMQILSFYIGTRIVLSWAMLVRLMYCSCNISVEITCFEQ